MNRYRQLLLGVAILVVAITGYLIAMNVRSPGLCPAYPVLGVPACIVVEVYFVAMFGALFIRSAGAAKVGFYIPAAAAFATSVYFSARELLDLGSCPTLFDVPLPLCFTVFPTVGLMMFLFVKAGSAAQP